MTSSSRDFGSSSSSSRTSRVWRACACAAVVVVLLSLAGCFGGAAAGSSQYGARRIDFAVGDAKGFVILPAQTAAGGARPWVWYAPTFIGKLPDDSHAWMAKQWLDAGVAIAGVDVGESFGSPTGRAIYSDFHRIVTTRFRLDHKACLLPQSRGGLMLLNWASENPGRVRCIAGIYTVCNIESYPGVDKACAAYEMDADTLRAHLAEHNPIDRVEPLAEARVPILFIHGDSDTVVPIETNAGEYVARCNALGGDASIIVVPGKGHEVCPEFFQSQAFTDFVSKRGRVK